MGLGLVAAWILLGVARPSEALAGFASKEWLFVVAVYGLAAATARSGLLYRIGLLLVRRVPHGTLQQAATLLLTGLALTPLIPSATGRASLVLPLARALAEALRIPDRSGASAVLGLAAWTGAGPLMFVSLSGSGTCLLAWGLLPEASRARVGWVQWLVAAAAAGGVPRGWGRSSSCSCCSAPLPWPHRLASASGSRWRSSGRPRAARSPWRSSWR